jgi:predicted nucleic acid-binding protein
LAVLIDSTVFITAERRGLRPDDLLAVVPNEPSALSTISISELLYGVFRADTANRRDRRTAFVEAVLASFEVLPFDLSTARIHAQLGSDLHALGRPIGNHDRIIAATALVHGFDILTENVREFDQVPGLTVRRPAW